MCHFCVQHADGGRWYEMARHYAAKMYSYQKEEARKILDSLNIKIPKDMDLKKIPGLSWEIVERLTALSPETLLQAGRIPGITPSALIILRVEIEKRRKK